MNKFLIPAALIATVIIAGIFAFMPVEKASTVHGNLATSSAATTNTNTITDRITTETDGQNRAIDFYFNMSHGHQLPGGYNITIVLDEPGKTFTGYAMLTAIPNNASATQGTILHPMNCGLQTTGSDGTKNKLGFNATAGQTNFTRFSAANGLTANEGIEVVLVNQTAAGTNNMGGVCAGTIVLTNWGS